jgi:hypothetical protein
MSLNLAVLKSPLQHLQKFHALDYRKQVHAVIVVAGCLGFLFGVTGSTIQVAVEQGQVLAGVVHYPVDNAFFIYQAKAWNIWAQLAAMALSVGISEVALSIFLSGLSGTLFFVGFALPVLAITKNPVITIISPFLGVTLFVLTYVVFQGFSYPLNILGSSHSYGLLGISFMFLCIGLLTAAEYRWAFLLLGLAPAAHASLGIWTLFAAGTAILFDYKNIVRWMQYIPYGLLGIAMSASSYFLQQSLFAVPVLAPEVQQLYLSAYLTIWDLHRTSPLNTLLQSSAGVVYLINTLLLCMTLLRIQRSDPDTGSQLYLRVAAACVTIGVVFTIWTGLELPFSTQISILLPTRFLNLAVLCYFAILVSVLLKYRDEIWVPIVITLSVLFELIFCLLFSFTGAIALIPLLVIVPIVLMKKTPSRRMLPILLSCLVIVVFLISMLDTVSTDPKNTILLSLSTLVLGFLAVRVDLSIHFTSARFRFIRRLHNTLGAALVILILVAVRWGHFNNEMRSLRETFYTDDFWREVSQGDKMLVISSSEFYMTQLKTRRALVFEAGAMDFLPYTPQGAPQIAEVLDAIYGIDFFDPPSQARHQGSLPPLNEVQACWEARTPEEWSALAEEFQFGQILTPEDWHLQLSIRAQSSFAILYDISNSQTESD